MSVLETAVRIPTFRIDLFDSFGEMCVSEWIGSRAKSRTYRKEKRHFSEKGKNERLACCEGAKSNGIFDESLNCINF